MSNTKDENFEHNFCESDFSYELNDSFSLWLHDIRKFKPYASKEEELEAARHLKDNPENRNEFINRHLPLVLAVIRDFKNSHDLYPNINDMVQVGNDALIKAVDKFDPNKGVWFGSYARKCIDGYIKNLNAQTLVGVPKDKIVELGQLNKLITECAMELCRQPTKDEILEYVGDEFTKEEIDELYQIKNKIDVYSFDAEIDEESGASLYDIVADEAEESPEEFTNKSLSAERLFEIYKRELNELELDIWMNQEKFTKIRNNAGNPKWLYTEIWKSYPSQIKSREMARQIVLRINKKLRTPSVWKEIQKLKGN